MIRTGLTTIVWIFLVPVLAVLPTQSVADEEAPEPLPSDPVFEVLKTDASTVRGRIRSMSSEGRLELINEEGEEFLVEDDELVKFSQARFELSKPRSDAPLIVLPQGDQIRGHIDTANENSVVLRSSILGELTLPLDVVVGFSITPDREIQAEFETIRRLRDESRNSDRLLLVNGDERDVIFSALTESDVAYLDSDRSLKLPREMVRAIGLDPALVQTPEVSGRSFDLILSDGTRLRLLDPHIRAGKIQGRSTFGIDVDAPLSRLTDCYNLGDEVVYLSDLETPREVTVPYIGPVRPARPNASVIGTPLTVNGRHYFRGLGTQSRSLLAYPLQASDDRFQATLAIDDIAGPLANVVFRVLVDGEQQYVSPPIAAGDPPIMIDVDVSGGQFLILVTEFGQGGGVRDYASWIEARLIRKAVILPTD